MNRIKPYLVILFIIWPLMTVLSAYSMLDQTSNAQSKIDRSQLVMAKVLEVKSWKTGPRHGSKTENFWAYYKIPTPTGEIDGEGPISRDTYNAITTGKVERISIYLNGFRNWPTENWDNQANRGSYENWFLGAIIGLPISPFIYYVFSLIPFGSARKSLKERWK